MTDLTRKFNLTVEEYSRPLSAKGLISMIGLPFGGVILDNAYSKIELAFSVNVFILGLSMVLLPWFESLTLQGLLFGIVGFCYVNVYICKYHFYIYINNTLHVYDILYLVKQIQNKYTLDSFCSEFF